VTTSIHDGHWTLVEDDTNGQLCSHCGERCHSYWAWFATATLCTTRYCTTCVDDPESDLFA